MGNENAGFRIFILHFPFSDMVVLSRISIQSKNDGVNWDISDLGLCSGILEITKRFPLGLRQVFAV